MFEFEPVIESAGGEHEDSSQAENDVGDDGDGVGDCAKDEDEGADPDKYGSDEMGDCVKWFADFCHLVSIVTYRKR